jgi:hypothetical protein
MNGSAPKRERQPSPMKRPAVVNYESDIDPDDLLPAYLGKITGELKMFESVVFYG